LNKEINGIGESGMTGWGKLSYRLSKEYEKINIKISELDKIKNLFLNESLKIEYFMKNNSNPIEVIKIINKINLKILKNREKYHIGYKNYSLPPLSTMEHLINIIEDKKDIYTFLAILIIRVVFLNHPLQDKLKFHNPAEMKINKSLSSSI
jgi:hypothetical protein